MASKLIAFIVFLSFMNTSLCGEPAYETRFLAPGRPYNASLNYIQKLCIYCYRGIPKHLLHTWQTTFITINLHASEYDLYKGTSPENVLHLLENEKKSWANMFFSWKSNKISIDPFTLNCIGIDTAYDHVVELNVIRIDFWRVLRFGIGVFMFLAAPTLSANPVFYYICGVLLGITTSVFIALYLISKIIPKKPTVYAVVIGGWTVAVYLFQLLWDNIKIIAPNYYAHVLTYVIVTGFVSFIVCYRFGPVSDPRSKNLIKWAMQIASLVLIFYSSKCPEASLLFDILLLVYYNFSGKWFSYFLSIWRKKFPPSRNLLTEDEYHEQGARETIRALENLRQYCSSSECNQWKTILSLQQPIRYKKERFAQFMEGSSHLEDSEILAYESKSSKNAPLLTDDSDSDDED